MSYNYFAQLYDDLTNNVEYEKRAEYILNILNEHGINNGTVLDLACGTGTMGLMVKNSGFDVIGVDLSEDMLSVADNKSNGSLSLVKASMQDFQLSKTVDACMCNLDSINHLNNIEDVKDTFKCVYNSLSKNGIFVFDVNTVYKHNNILANNSFVFDEEDFFLAWDNELLEDNIIKIFIDIFAYNGINYDRYSETFTEKAYEVNELKLALEPYFEVLDIFDDVSKEKPKNDSERLYFVCKRK